MTVVTTCAVYKINGICSCNNYSFTFIDIKNIERVYNFKYNILHIRSIDFYWQQAVILKPILLFYDAFKSLCVAQLEIFYMTLFHDVTFARNVVFECKTLSFELLIRFRLGF